MPRYGLAWFVFLIACAVAYGVLLQPPGCNQTAHYSLVQSLAHGSPRIDRYHDQTCDTAYVDGHYYSAKAPGSPSRRCRGTSSCARPMPFRPMRVSATRSLGRC